MQSQRTEIFVRKAGKAMEFVCYYGASTSGQSVFELHRSFCLAPLIISICRCRMLMLIVFVGAMKHVPYLPDIWPMTDDSSGDDTDVTLPPIRSPSLPGEAPIRKTNRKTSYSSG
ncbi:hypothetical protein K457DRAFT_13684 [Linnemannia elongata AG-77]|uniref:Uncharacterized protein n=1 Tax=Linnemannia elongata AG-77 TaxID=1314771 RepID=A0A197KBN6_9FUNG|nr:hypothetical protein K457DRAFT_13684 [Linnemannia elongata AG-77]